MRRHLLFLTLTMMYISSCTEETTPPPVGGVSFDLAQERVQRISNIHYQMFFSIPESKTEAISSQIQISFELKDKKRPVALDFREEPDHVLAIKSEGITVDYEFLNGHLILPTAVLKKGHNQFHIDFIAGDLSLNRNEEYLYTLLVPDRAATVFPCFDQPDLKARFQLNLEIPKDWEAMSNGSKDKEQIIGERKTYSFRESAPISTYLFAFAAGIFQQKTAERDGRIMNMLYRESDTSKVAHNADAIFDLHAHALQWLEEYTGISYPFEKFDFVLIPTFQYGGMEHVGAIFYKEPSLMLDPNATTNQLLGRAKLIAHETAHMWFGDLVTMKWFDDVWLKEVFANFMAAKIANPSFPDINHDLSFLLAHQPTAYGEDRSDGSHPIQQPLENLKDAGTLYGRIIYQKAPVVMQQLEALMGADALQEGLQKYLRQYTWGNASWDDLMSILDRLNDQDLSGWSQVWVKEAGMPVFNMEWEFEKGKLTKLQLKQEKKSAGGRYWPQQTKLAFIYPDTVLIHPLTIKGEINELPQAKGMDAPFSPSAQCIGHELRVFSPG